MEQPKTVAAGTPLKIVSSGKWNLNLRDFLKGGVMAVGGAVAQALMLWVKDPSFAFDNQTLTKIASTAIIACGVYLGKNLVTDAKVVAVDSEAK